MNNVRHMSRVLFFGYTVSEAVIAEICRLDKYLPMQQYKLEWSVIRGLESTGIHVDLLSSLPIALYPGYPQVLVRGSKWNWNGSHCSASTTYINLLVVRHLTRFVSSFVKLIVWARHFRAVCHKSILVHGLHTGHLFSAIIAGLMFRIPVVVIITDPPSPSLPGEGNLVLGLRKIEQRLINWALSLADGVVGLTQEIHSLMCPHLSFMLMEGILSATDQDNALKDVDGARVVRVNPPVLLYAGGLEPDYGVRLCLDTLAAYKDLRCEMWFAGKGSCADQVAAIAAVDPRVKFLGLLSQDELAATFKKADVLLNPRPTSSSFTKLTFPSKLLQYMATGLPVISTRQAGIPAEYWNYLIALDDETSQGLASLIRSLVSKPMDEVKRRSMLGRAFVLEQKSEGAQGKRLADFLLAVWRRGGKDETEEKLLVVP
jgi:glycosyltransferase involved in cell wall biosynthesis